MLNTQIVGLECAGWSLDRLFKDRELFRLSYRAAKESIDVASRQMGKRAPLPMRMLRGWQLRMVMGLARRVAPLDVERFFEYHYGKVGDQTHYMLQYAADAGKRHGVSTPALASLTQRLKETQARASLEGHE